MIYGFIGCAVCLAACFVVPASWGDIAQYAYFFTLLQSRGACRVHGGGFARTAQAFVPVGILDSFKQGIEAVLGQGSCHVLSI